MECNTPLPEDFDECEAYVLGVVGLNRAGKSYFIGSAFNEAVRHDGLRDYGVEGFAPLDDTAARLHNDYYLHLYRGAHQLDTTPRYEHLERPALSFRVSYPYMEDFLLITHDISGEALMERNDRAVATPFLRWADAVIFIVDPTDIDVLADGPLREEAELISYRNLNQAALLEAILNEIPKWKADPIPLAITISKADLLSDSLRLSPSLLNATDTQNWLADVRHTSVIVKQLLLDLGERRLVGLAEAHGRSTFHLVSALGIGNPGGRPHPIRVLDPLAAALELLRRTILKSHAS